MRVINILEHHKFPPHVREFKFSPSRQWRADFAWPDQKVILECEGGIWNNGGHVRGVHYSCDCEKYNQAQILGYRVLRYTDKNIYSIPDDLKALGL
jgi:very-short-patch-repair endonuclease